MKRSSGRRGFERSGHARQDRSSTHDRAKHRLFDGPGILEFISTIEDPRRFHRSTDVGAYLGLGPRAHQSGESDRLGRITKAGDDLTRSYLVEAANVLLTRIVRTCLLRRWDLRIMQRAGLKKAQVAVARKLATMLHAIWSDGTDFEWGAEMA